MRIKELVVLAAITLTVCAREENGVKSLDECFHSVSVTSESLVLSQPKGPFLFRQKGIDRWLKQDEEIVLTPDCETTLTDGYHVVLVFTPVSFKGGKKGFKIASIFNGLSFGKGITINNMYLALSDTPVEVGEDDVEMIQEGGEWVKFEGNKDLDMTLTWAPPVEKRGGAQETPPIIEAPVAANVATASLPLTEDGTQRLEAVATIDTPPSRLWLYAFIPLALAVLWLAHRKRKHGTKN